MRDKMTGNISDNISDKMSDKMIDNDCQMISAYFVSGLPHILSEQSKGWTALRKSCDVIREEIAQNRPDVLLYFSTQWLSVLGYLFQMDPHPKWTHVDHNWYELGSLPYEFRVDTALGEMCRQEVSHLGHYTRGVNEYGFPIDTATIVAQKLLNPDNQFPVSMLSCNMYSEKDETLEVGQACMRALERSKKRAVVIIVSNLSNRFHVTDIHPADDRISSLKDDEWNRKILNLLGEGRLEDVSEVVREFAAQANADCGGKGFWFLNGLCGQHNHFRGHVFEYQSVWGAGAATIGLYPTQKIVPLARIEKHDLDVVESLNAKAHQRKRVGPSLKSNGKMCVSSSEAAEPVGPYPHARRVGDFLYLSGMGPRKRGSSQIPGVVVKEGKISDHDIEIQTHATFKNVAAVLQEAGATLSDVVDVQVFLTHMKRDFSKFNEIYQHYFGNNGPSRTTVEVSSLPTPIAIELKVIAHLARL